MYKQQVKHYLLPTSPAYVLLFSYPVNPLTLSGIKIILGYVCYY